MRRLHCDTATWHVFARGTRRLELFQDDEDLLKFASLLSYGTHRAECDLVAYALMSNHYHLVVQGDSDALSKGMHLVNRMYSRYHNRRYKLEGHTFDGPYQAFRQASPLLSLNTIAYVFLNPVKGGLCQAPENYRWSGYRSFVGLPGSPIPVHSTAVMSQIDLAPRRFWRRFQEVLRRETSRPARTTQGRPTMTDIHQQQFRWLLDHAREHPELLSGEDPVEISAYRARRCGVTPRAMAKELGMSDSSEIREILRRVKIRINEDSLLAQLCEIP